MITTQGFELLPWQQAAVDAWATGHDTPFHGTLEIFTGGGKSLIALQCAATAARQDPDVRLAVVVPTEALAHQWRRVILDYTNVAPTDIGLLGAGGDDDLHTKRVLVAVLNTAARRLPEMSERTTPLMLVVDECHRAGAPAFSRVLTTRADYRLGLSATPEREEFTDDGEPLQYDEQIVGRLLGPLVHRFSLKDARSIGWLPDYEVHHHGVSLMAEERRDYEALSRRVTEAADEIRSGGGDSSRAHQLQRRDDELGNAARAYIALTAERKDLLYRASDRGRVASAIVERATTESSRKVLLFHERVDQAADLAATLRERMGQQLVALEHSRLPDRERADALDAFRSGRSPILVSVRSLVEGIDVPDAEIGISVAASSSVRQRIQSLGRVLRRRFDEPARAKHAEMHLVYVADTVDESIYAKEDWGDLTGEAVNHYWIWGLDPTLPPERRDGPPATPRPTEDAEWQRLGATAPTTPIEWRGSYIGQEYSVDTLGNVTNRSGSLISNPQGVDQLVAAVRGRSGGRFRVTPTHRLVLVTGGDGEGRLFVAGALAEPFIAVQAPESGLPGVDFDVSNLTAGDPYPGPTDKDMGTFQLRAKRGGVIERKVSGGSEFATVDTTAESPTDIELISNAKRVLHAWRTVLERGITFYVNSRGHAWYTESGQIRFLASVPGGFSWPTEEVNDDDDLPGQSAVKREQGREVHGAEGAE